MSEEIPAIAVIEGYRKLVAETTEENIILKWQIQQQTTRITHQDEQIKQLVAAMAEVGGSTQNGDTPVEDPVESI